jgi:hypothetical protein
MSHPFVMMRAMSAIVLQLPQARLRRRAGTTSRRGRATPASIVDLATYRRSRSARVRQPRLDLDDDDDEEEDCWEVRVHGVIDAAEALLEAGHREDVLEFCARAAACLGRNAAEIGDAGAVVGLTTRLGELRARAGNG